MKQTCELSLFWSQVLQCATAKIPAVRGVSILTIKNDNSPRAADNVENSCAAAAALDKS